MALRLAKTGDHSLLLADRDEAGLNSVAAELEGICPVATIAGDLSTADFPAEVIARCVDVYGRIDGVVSNAGVLKGAPLSELSIEDFDFLFDINARPAWLLGKAAYPHLKISRGSIVATASLGAWLQSPPIASEPDSLADLVRVGLEVGLECAATASPRGPLSHP